MQFYDFIINKQIIKPEDVDRFNEDIKKFSIEQALLNYGFTENDILEVKGEFSNLPVRQVDPKVVHDILKYIPEQSAAFYKIVPIGIQDGFLEVGILNPDSMESRDALNFISTRINMPFKLFLISEENYGEIMSAYKGLSNEVSRALSDYEDELKKDEEELQVIKKDEKQETTIVEEAPVPTMVNTIIRYAVDGNASDVHIEAMLDKVRIRYRIDGELHTLLELPSKVHDAVVANIKIQCNMRIDEKRKPQDGSFTKIIDSRRVDFRVSTFPTTYGEKVVMRILDKEKGVRKLSDLGMSEYNVATVKEALQAPYGLILISGPTGSGKSTTLFAMLNEVDREGKNVLTLEDPVEYNIDGISQSQVRPEIGYDFANGLRTTLRQDPDIIMVGEIRDKETAGLAIQAALTGHLVLSTIHTNTSSGIIPRLIDMGVDPYLIPSTLIMGMAQRLVRKNAPGAGKVVPIDEARRKIINESFADLPPEALAKIELSDEILELTPAPDGSPGVKGRMVVSEMYRMDRDLAQVILTNPVEAEVYKCVRAKGMLTVKEDAILKVFKKEIPVEEVDNL